MLESCDNGINDGRRDLICRGDDVLQSKERDLMSSKIAAAGLIVSQIMMAILSVVIALTSPSLAASNGRRDNGFMSRDSQYCVPQYDSSGAQRAPYC